MIEWRRTPSRNFGQDSREIREILGYAEFKHRIPEDIAFREYPHLRAVEVARTKRWFGRNEVAELEIAKRAWEETLLHRRRLIEDRTFRAIDQVRANVATDLLLRSYNYATRWEAPYLICYASKERMSDYDLLSISR